MNNPPAFPGPSHISGYGNCTPITLQNGETVWQENHDGMTLRDYFAAKAMQGWMATYVQRDDVHPSSNDCSQSVADLSYEIADAMLTAREKATKEAL